MSDWQPIETAPQDGTRILINFEGLNDYYHKSNIFIARWESRRWITDCETLWVGRATATHWAPLNPPQ